MDAAIAMYAALQSQLDVSKKELKDIEKLLMEAEQRAVNDGNDHVKLEGGRNKRRKVSPPPQDDTNNSAGVTVKKEEESDHHYDDETDKEDGDKEDGKEEDDDGSTKLPATNNSASANNNNPAGSQSNDDMNTTAASTSNNHEALGSGDASQSTSSNNVKADQVIVEDCGLSEFNGTYTKVIGHMYDGAPVYSKGKGCVIYCDSKSMGNNNWFISCWDGNVNNIGKYSHCYGSPNNADSMTPPTNGWVVLLNGYGLNPAPNLQLATANNDANSEGAQKVSGNNGSFSTAGPSSAAQSSRNVVQVMASKDAWKLLMKHFSFTFFGGKYCYPGKENRPLKDSSAVLGVNYFSTIEELRQHLRTFGLPEATGQLDRDI